MKRIRNKIPKGKIRYAFAVSRDAEGNPVLYAVRQCFSKKKKRYINDIDGKAERGSVAKPVSLEEAHNLLAAGLENEWSGSGIV